MIEWFVALILTIAVLLGFLIRTVTRQIGGEGILTGVNSTPNKTTQIKLKQPPSRDGCCFSQYNTYTLTLLQQGKQAIDTTRVPTTRIEELNVR